LFRQESSPPTIFFGIIRRLFPRQGAFLFYARSEDGLTWPRFEPFVADTSLTLNFLPVHATLGGTDYVVFQSFIPGSINRPSYQLYLKTSTDGGRTWSAARRVTSFNDPYMFSGASPDAFNNERPHLLAWEGGLFTVWERRYASSAPLSVLRNDHDKRWW